MKECHVGIYDDSLGITPFIELIHPREFSKYVNKLYEPIWTNNPLLVDCFNWDQIFVHYGNSVKRLDEHPQFKKWRAEFSPGEFWSMVGENWVCQ